METLVIVIFWIYCCLFPFDPFRRIYVSSTTIDDFLFAYLMHYWQIIKNKVAILHELFQIYLVLMHEWIKMVYEVTIMKILWTVITVWRHSLVSSHPCKSKLFSLVLKKYPKIDIIVFSFLSNLVRFLSPIQNNLTGLFLQNCF